MSLTSFRIRRARTQARLSQAALAKRLGINRSAVSQWECAQGTCPSVEHLVGIATATGVCFEWLATGRGASRPESGQFDTAVVIEDFARDEIESQVLAGFRSAPLRKREAVLHLMQLFLTA